MRAVVFPEKDSSVPELARLDRSLELLLLARAAVPVGAHAAGRARSRGRDRRRTLERWAAELGVPRSLVDAIADALFDREGATGRRREPVVTVELLVPAPPRHATPIIVAPECVGVHSS